VANADIEAACVFHEITKHSYTSVRSVPHHLDWKNRPMAYKIYPAAGAVALPRDLTLPAMPAFAALAGNAPPDPDTPLDDTPLDLANLTRILFCADGLTRRNRVGGEDYHFRSAASAGALYPIEIYLAAGEVEGLEPGLYHYSPADLKLRGLRRGDWRGLIARAAAMRPSIMEARAVLLMSAIFWRSAWKYRARAFRYCFWDTGTILANLLAATNAEGIKTEVITAFEDARIETLIGAEGDREGVMCIVALGGNAKPDAASPEPGPLDLETIPLSAEEVIYDDLVKIQRASRLVSEEEVRSVASAQIDLPTAPQAFHLSPRSVVALTSVHESPPSLKANMGRGLGETILTRGSTRVFAHEAIGADELATIMAASSIHPHADFPRLSDTYLVVNAVDGMEPGAYYYRRESGEFELIKRGDFRREAGYLALGQPLGADSSVLICYMTDLMRVLGALGNRGYRDAHLEAGILGGRAYLAAYSLDRGATGLTFYDDDTTRFFEPHAAGKSPLLMVAIGVPRSRSTQDE
jgi:SagB-type dehydrogenase family enzyme